MYEFLQQKILGLYRNLRLLCCLISKWTRSDKRILLLLSIFAALDIFPCLPFANTTDCKSPSSINIWWCRTLKVINKNFGLGHHPSPSFCAGKNTNPRCKLSGPAAALLSSGDPLSSVCSDLMGSLGSEMLAY